MKTPLYAALDLHSRYSVLGNMDYDGNTQPQIRFPTSALCFGKTSKHCGRRSGRSISRWKRARSPAGLARLRDHWGALDHLRAARQSAYQSNPTKSDEADVEGMCLLRRLGKLKEVWMGQDRIREIYRPLVDELLTGAMPSANSKR